MDRNGCAGSTARSVRYSRRAIADEVTDPGVGFVTVTSVETSGDLRHAKVYVSTFGDAAEQQATLDALNRAKRLLQSSIARALRLKYTPVLEFHLDDSARGPSASTRSCATTRRRRRRERGRVDDGGHRRRGGRSAPRRHAHPAGHPHAPGRRCPRLAHGVAPRTQAARDPDRDLPLRKDAVLPDELEPFDLGVVVDEATVRLSGGRTVVFLDCGNADRSPLGDRLGEMTTV